MISTRQFSLFVGLVFPLISACGGGSSRPDTMPPVVVSTSPAHNAVDVSPLCPIIAHFNESLDPSSVSETSFLIRPEGGSPISGDVSLADSRTVQFEPKHPLEKGRHYVARLTTAITDRAGNPLRTDKEWEFTVLPEGLDEWRAIASGGPSARRDHSSVWTGKEMIVWGAEPTSAFFVRLPLRFLRQYLVCHGECILRSVRTHDRLDRYGADCLGWAQCTRRTNESRRAL